MSSARRRLWELPPQAHELLAAMAVPPALLQRAAERALGRLHKARCELKGSAADVLYAVVHDLGTRNAVSEAVQQLLDTRHAPQLRSVATLREPAALDAWWRQQQGSGAEAGALWALLTHPQGPVLQDAALYEARTWVFTQARLALADREREARHTAREQALAAGHQALQLRLQALQAERDEERIAAQATIAALRGALAAAQAHERPTAPTVPRARALPAGPAPRRAGAKAEPIVMHRNAPPAAPPPDLVRGRRVLCVGGMPGAQARYRDIVETAGGRFEYHDGGIEHSVQRLDQQLGAADLVVCQAGCLNHEAYRRVKGHCRRADKPCLFVERPSLAHFARTLGVGGSASEPAPLAARPAG